MIPRGSSLHRCPACGAGIDPSSTERIAVCRYCNTRIEMYPAAEGVTGKKPWRDLIPPGAADKLSALIKKRITILAAAALGIAALYCRSYRNHGPGEKISPGLQ